MKHLYFKHNDYSISLLTDEEFEKYNYIIPRINDWWWLQPPITVNQKDENDNDDDQQESRTVKFVNLDGFKNDLGWEPFYRIGIRPVIRYNFDEFVPGDTFIALGNRWIVLDKKLAISLDTICHKRIDASAWYWEKILKTKDNKYCELKIWLEEWGRLGEIDE